MEARICRNHKQFLLARCRDSPLDGLSLLWRCLHRGLPPLNSQKSCPAPDRPFSIEPWLVCLEVSPHCALSRWLPELLSVASNQQRTRVVAVTIASEVNPQIVLLHP